MNLPHSFVERMHRLLGDEADAFFHSLESESPVSIRINRSKTDCTLSFPPIPWSGNGFYLPERLHFTFDPLFHAGAYYVQEASSMFLEQVIQTYITEPVRCLDLCAAPGGKSTHLASLLPEGSLLVCNEVIKSRSHILAENMGKWGNPSVIVTNSDPEQVGRLTGLFDVIITDVPCSGEGMFRKDPASIGEWSEANVELCAARQRRIIHDIWPALAPSGLLVYSTCTYNTKENEENIRYIADEYKADILSVEVPPEWGISGSLSEGIPAYRFFPHKIKGEGFFMAILRKPDDDSGRYSSKANKKRQDKKQLPVPESVRQLITVPGQFSFEPAGSGFRAFPLIHQQAWNTIREQIRVVSAGVYLGEVKGKDFIPSQELALSNSLVPGIYEEWDLSWEEAIPYLRREPLPPPTGKPKGFLLVTNKGIPLGFIKNLGNRTNNLYPNEWRIRSPHTPENPKTLVREL